MMQFTEDAAKKVLELVDEEKRNDLGIRIYAQSNESEVQYEVFWEDRALPKDIITHQEGLKIFVDPESNELLNETVIFFTVQDGEEGLFIMKTTSNCSTCSTVCF
ncbi:iron-sulfur cluster assembly accessory protein [Bacillus sp. 03113]|uniref:HesB/IscA family protein n=1 Tax=Bacillus sp. 03113 TaxID=2578211 RepID=UPI00114212EB|nr:iron-sulfur cluster biosynthesis family protein [Bacillus sp. 03113]